MLPNKIDSTRGKILDFRQKDKPVDTGGGPPYDGEMEARVAKLEDFAVDTRDRLVRIETRMDTLATKEELHKELHSLTWKILGGIGVICTGLVTLTYLVAKFVH